MSEIVSGVLKLTFEFLANKARGEIAERLKEGDVTDEECRRLILSEFDNITAKVDGLAKKDLKSSLCFLQEGIDGLHDSLVHLKSNKSASEQATLVDVSSSRNTCTDSPMNEAIALVNAIASLKIHSNEHFKSAVESFKLAREKATEAFSNDALPIEDRIQASQIRMMARILEKLEDPDASVRNCLQYLKQLHDIGAIRKMFSVLIDGGIKSLVKKTNRQSNASSVLLMNQLLFDFAREFTKLPPIIFYWPKILLSKKSYHPVFGEYRLVEKLGGKIMSPRPDFTFRDEIYPPRSAVSSKREIVAEMYEQYNENTITIFKPSGSEESRNLSVSKQEHAHAHAPKSWVCAMNIDSADNLYVITRIEEKFCQLRYKLYVFDKNGRIKHESPVPFPENFTGSVRISINEYGKIAVFIDDEKKTLYIGNVYINEFKIEKRFQLKDLRNDECVNMRFSYINGTKIIAAGTNIPFTSTQKTDGYNAK